MMKIYIINLTRSLDRKQFMTDQLTKLGLDFEFFAAIDGKCLEQKWKDKVCNSVFYNQITGQAGFIADGEIAVFASHYSLWEKCIEVNQPIIILEDDVILSHELKNKINYLEELVSQLNYVRLMALEKDRGHKVISPDLLLYTHFPVGAQGYVLSPLGAAKLLAKAKTWQAPIDMYLDEWTIHGLRAYCVNPELISTTEQIVSDIGIKNKQYLPKPKGFTKLVRELVRPFQQLKASYMNKKYPIVAAASLPEVNKNL